MAGAGALRGAVGGAVHPDRGAAAPVRRGDGQPFHLDLAGLTVRRTARRRAQGRAPPRTNRTRTRNPSVDASRVRTQPMSRTITETPADAASARPGRRRVRTPP